MLWFLRRYWISVGIVAAALVAWVLVYQEFRTRRQPDVVFVTTPPDVVAAMLDLAGVTDADTVYDLGCGDGRIVIAAAGRGARGVGIDIDPDRVAEAKEATRNAGVADRVTVRRGDIFAEDLTPATVIALYLLPQLNQKLIPQLDRLPPGRRVVSHQFSMPGVRPVKKVRVPGSDGLEHVLYLWRTPLDKE